MGDVVQMFSSIIVVEADLLPEAWEKSLVQLAEKGSVINTEYGEKSIDASAIIVLRNPFAEPRIHLKGIIAGSLKGLLDYVDEVLKGVHDHLVEKFGYTYHERLFAYKLPSGAVIDQIKEVIDKLKKTPYTRRAQAITWQPWKDLYSEHPPCLQRMWFRVVNDKLIMHVHMRSNDALKAAFMNIYAFTELQRYVAKQLDVRVGHYIHMVDSYHVYERDWKWFNKFVKQIRSKESRKRWITTQEYLNLISRLSKYT